MSFRVINTATDEVICELGNEDLAVTMAEGLAEKSNYQEQFAVIELVVRYETAPVKHQTEKQP